MPCRPHKPQHFELCPFSIVHHHSLRHCFVHKRQVLLDICTQNLKMILYTHLVRVACTDPINAHLGILTLPSSKRTPTPETPHPQGWGMRHTVVLQSRCSLMNEYILSLHDLRIFVFDSRNIAYFSMYKQKPISVRPLGILCNPTKPLIFLRWGYWAGQPLNPNLRTLTSGPGRDIASKRSYAASRTIQSLGLLTKQLTYCNASGENSKKNIVR